MSTHLKLQILAFALFLLPTNGKCVLFSEIAHPETHNNWIQLSLADPQEFRSRAPTAKEITFLRNTHFGLTSTFEPWFDHFGPEKNDTFETILKKQHIRTTEGRDGAEYKGYNREAHGGTQPQNVYPGKFRHEAVQVRTSSNGQMRSLPLPRIGILLHIERKVNPSTRLNRLRDIYTRNAPESRMVEISNSELDPLNKGVLSHLASDRNFQKHYVLDSIRLPDLPHLKTITNDIYEHSIAHSYPTHEEQPEIIERMSQLMTRLKTLATQSPKPYSQSVRREVLVLLEKYLYLGIHAHAFEATNFSLLMTHVNLILDRFGWNGIGPSNLDYVGLMEQFPQFQSEFRSRLKVTNPSIERFGVQKERAPLVTIATQDTRNRIFSAHEKQTHSLLNISGFATHSALPPNFKIQTWIKYKGERAFTEVDQGKWGSPKKGGEHDIELIAFQITSATEEHIPYQIHYEATTSDGNVHICEDGEVCGEPSQDKHIERLRVWITGPDPDHRSTGEGPFTQRQALATAVYKPPTSVATRHESETSPEVHPSSINRSSVGF